MGEYRIGLVGERNYQPAIRTCAAGDTVVLSHEPTNLYDQRAIVATNTDGNTLGYVPRDHWLGDILIDQQDNVAAVIHRVTGGEPSRPSRGIVLTVWTGEDARDRGAIPLEEAEDLGVALPDATPPTTPAARPSHAPPKSWFQRIFGI